MSERALAAGESVSGTVTDAATEVGIGGVEVCAWQVSISEETEAEEHCAFTAADGSYEIAPLGGGTYRVEFWPRGGGLNYIAEYYDDKRYWSEADHVYTGDVPTLGIDAELQEGGEIEGRVVSDVGGAPIEGVLACAWHVDHGEPGCDLTGPDGKYRIVGLREGDHTVEFAPEQSGLAFLAETYDDRPYGWVGHRVPVTVGDVTAGIDAGLEPASEIRGAVTAAFDGAPLQGILVCIAPPLDYDLYYFSDYGQCERTNGAGAYAFGGLEAGQYKAMFSVELHEYIHQIPPIPPEPDGYPTVYWNQAGTWEDADAVTLTAPTVATLDARLGPPAPPPVAPPALVAPTPPGSSLPRPAKRRCGKGLVRRKVKGRYRCVKRGRRHRRHRHRPRPDARSAGWRSARPSQWAGPASQDAKTPDRGFSMRLNGVEPSRPVRGTRPSNRRFGAFSVPLSALRCPEVS